MVSREHSTRPSFAKPKASTGRRRHRYPTTLEIGRPPPYLTCLLTRSWHPSHVEQLLNIRQTLFLKLGNGSCLPLDNRPIECSRLMIRLLNLVEHLIRVMTKETSLLLLDRPLNTLQQLLALLLQYTPTQLLHRNPALDVTLPMYRHPLTH